MIINSLNYTQAGRKIPFIDKTSKIYKMPKDFRHAPKPKNCRYSPTMTP